MNPFTPANLSSGVFSLVVIVLVVFILAVAAHLGLRWWLHRRARRDEDKAARLPTERNRVRWLISRSVRDGVPPLALLIWIHAVYAVLLALAARFFAGRDTTPIAWLYASSVTGAVVWLFWRAGVIIQAFLVSFARESSSAWDTVMAPLAGRAARRLLPLIALTACVSIMRWSPAMQAALRSVSIVMVIGVATWLLFQATDAAATLLLRRHPTDVANNLQARSIHTQVLVLKKMLNVVIGIVALASMLMSFDAARQLGASILASAGIAGIVVGLAAQRSIATLLAGFQIALTQPIRVDDVVVVEGEWGRIETITLTYVIVRIWDQRRLVVPVAQFIEKPFENWTHTSAELLGSVYLQVDYSVPVDLLRLELTRILTASKDWDGKVNALQLTDVKEHAIEIRALASAADASRVWDLRCEVREKLIAFIQRRFPDSLPRVRTALSAVPRSRVAGTPA